MTFNIGSQQGTISNVAGNQVVHGGQHTMVGAAPAVLEAIGQIRSALPQLNLSAHDRAVADNELAGLERELAGGQVVAEQTAGRLDRILTMMKKAGAVITATNTLGTAVSTLAGWLGPVGSTLLRLIL